jgi:protein tyrosine phosphatase (PTP) superfamily phosphohydrolase (DUF442 family)
MATATRKLGVGLLVVLTVAFSYVFFRSVYEHSRRLRVIDPGRVYRSGQMTAEGFADAVRRLGIKTIINVQDDFPDPDISHSYWDRSTIKESELCWQLGVRFVFLEPDLISKWSPPGARPAGIDQFLQLMDDPSVYPVLIHCKAGLHRTGVLSAVYRMEYQGWSRAEAYRELKAHGFGAWVCTDANEYVKQYVLSYTPGQRHSSAGTDKAE